jgi:flagellar motor switch/type III secretory pathway protein FliN
VTSVLERYPWDLIPRVPRRAVREARRVRARADACLSLSAIEGALSSVLSCHVMIVIRSTVPSESWPAADEAVHLVATDRSLVVSLEPEAALASVVLSLALSRGGTLAVPRLDAPMDPSTQGALAAVAVEVARRAEARIPFRAVSGGPSGIGLRVDVTLFLDDKPYALSVRVREGSPVSAVTGSPGGLTSLGDLPIELPLVASISTGARAEVSSLRPGDVWLPARPPWQPADGASSVLPRVSALSAPNGDRGVLVHRSEDGRIVIGGEVVSLPLDASYAPHGPTAAEPMSDPEDTLQRLAVEAPVVVRVEVGTVTLPARQWAELRAGDVIETGLRLAEPVVLRIAGQEVARGELVSVDGELGVRIRELVPGSSQR